MKITLAATVTLAALILAGCEQTTPPADTVAAEEAASQAPDTAPPTSPAQASEADKAAAK